MGPQGLPLDLLSAFVANVPCGVSEKEIRSVLFAAGHHEHVTNVKMLHKGQGLWGGAIITWETVAQCEAAIASLHDYTPFTDERGWWPRALMARQLRLTICS